MRSDLLAATGRAAQSPVSQTVRFRDPHIEMTHGAGGKASRRLIDGLIAPLVGLPPDALSDAAVVHLGAETLAFTGDAFVVRPLTFPGGSIGELAVNGTVNDLAVTGARPLGLLVTLIVEAGTETQVLEAEMRAMGKAATCAGVAVVGGDTKVVEHGKADGLYISSAGFGRLDSRFILSPRLVQPGDRVLVSGSVGDHGVTILLARGDIDLDANLCSDTRSVWPLVDALGHTAAAGVRWMRDPTRGGIASVLNELARETGLTLAIDEAALPVRDEVRGACELLGLDPLHIANEGQFVAVVAPGHADQALDALRATDGGERAAIIGEVRSDSGGVVLAASRYGSARIVDMLVGDPLPRIC